LSPRPCRRRPPGAPPEQRAPPKRAPIAVTTPLTTAAATHLWQRLPRHVQLLAASLDADAAPPLPGGHEPGNGSGGAAPAETRTQMIQRLLDPAVSAPDAARLLGVSLTTVRHYAVQGVLPCYRGGGAAAGQARRFRLSDVLALWERQQAPAHETTAASTNADA
jgi:hypothetical protein